MVKADAFSKHLLLFAVCNCDSDQCFSAQMANNDEKTFSVCQWMEMLELR